MRVLIALISALLLIVPSVLAADTLPRELSDEAFWRLISDFSEQGGAFRFEYMSNELQYQYVVPRLKSDRKPGNVYLGVGPEQNFTYIAAIQPKMAFIFDIRRQNMTLIFEKSRPACSAPCLTNPRHHLIRCGSANWRMTPSPIRPAHCKAFGP